MWLSVWSNLSARIRLAKSRNPLDNNSRNMVIIIPESVMTCLLPLKGDKEKKRLDLLERKKENQRLLDEESARIKGRSQKELMCGGKVTRAQIEEALQAEQLKQEQLEIRPKGQSIPDNSAVKHHLSLFKIKFYSHRNDPPGDSSGGEHQQNCSRWRNRGGENSRRCHRRSEVLLLLSFSTSWKHLVIMNSVSSTGPEDQDHHPERRMKAAFAAYEEANMPRLKKENPNMRLSQLKQQLKKEWMKAPENPLNQCFTAYNAKWKTSCNFGFLLWKCELNLSSSDDKLTLQCQVKGHTSSLCLCTISLTKLFSATTSWILVLSGRWQAQFCESNLLKCPIRSSSLFQQLML